MALAAHRLGLVLPLLLPAHPKRTSPFDAKRQTSAVSSPAGRARRRPESWPLRRKPASPCALPWAAEMALRTFLEKRWRAEPCHGPGGDPLVPEPIFYFTSGTAGAAQGVLHDHAFTLANHWGALHAGHPRRVLHFATGDTGWELVSRLSSSMASGSIWAPCWSTTMTAFRRKRSSLF